MKLSELIKQNLMLFDKDELVNMVMNGGYDREKFLRSVFDQAYGVSEMAEVINKLVEMESAQ